MTTVSITDFRDNLATYLRLVKYEGERLMVVDSKMDEVMVEVVPPLEKTTAEDKIEFIEKMYGVLGTLTTDKNRKALRKADKDLIKRRLQR